MEAKKIKLRCRKKGIVVDYSYNLLKYDIVWKRDFRTGIYTLDLVFIKSERI
jgi:hypothetical protein